MGMQGNNEKGNGFVSAALDRKVKVTKTRNGFSATTFRLRNC